MENIQYLHILVLFLASLACLENQFTEGRQLSDLKKNESRAIKNEAELQTHAMKSINRKQSPGSERDNPHVTGHKQMTPYHGNEIVSSDISHLDDFRPTAPGNSPGVGHSFAGQKDHVQAKAKTYGSLTKHSVAGYADDFRPTGPGHSPGVGHYNQNMDK